MVKSTGEAAVGMMIDLANHIIVEGVVSAEWKLSTIVNCYKGKGDASEKEIYRTEINNTNSGDSWKNYREVDYKRHCYFETVGRNRRKISTKKEFVLCICRYGESFSSSVLGCCIVSFEETKCRKGVA